MYIHEAVIVAQQDAQPATGISQIKVEVGSRFQIIFQESLFQERITELSLDITIIDSKDNASFYSSFLLIIILGPLSIRISKPLSPFKLSMLQFKIIKSKS